MISNCPALPAESPLSAGIGKPSAGSKRYSFLSLSPMSTATHHGRSSGLLLSELASGNAKTAASILHCRSKRI